MFSQTKNEKEERVALESFPEASKTIISQLPKDCKKLKFYKETDNDKVSYEAKFKFNKRRYSLEFSESGNVEDIEVTIKFKSINKKIKSAIEAYFKDEFKKSKTLKSQEQFILLNRVNPSEVIEKILLNKSDISPNFEIIAEVTSASDRSVREFTFNSEGTLTYQRVVSPSSYEHILY